MMKISLKLPKALSILILFSFIMFHSISFAETKLPTDWQNWTQVVTPAVKMGSLPDCNADVSHLPDIYQDMISTYCSVRPEGPGKIRVLVKPSMLESFKAKSGDFKDGYNLILHLMDLKILFVTSQAKGEPDYNVFLEDGKNNKRNGSFKRKDLSRASLRV